MTSFSLNHQNFFSRNSKHLLQHESFLVLKIFVGQTQIFRFEIGFDFFVFFDVFRFNFQYDYPLVESNEKRFLNSGGFIGYASDIYQMITSQGDVRDDDDDQLFYTKMFLDRIQNENVVLDKRAQIFFNLNGAEDEIELPLTDDEVYVRNSWTDSIPTVIHGNGPSKVESIRKKNVFFTNLFCFF